MSASTNRPDVFGMALEKFTVAELWEILDLPGAPKASCKSPFREDHSPSFSIHSDGKAWTDHGTGEGGDVVQFLMQALGIDHLGARHWFADKMNIPSGSALPASKPATASKPRKTISWPGEIIEGSQATWNAFAKHRGFTYPATWAMVKTGLLRFVKIDGMKCFIVTDNARRAAEIRRIDGQPFGKCKAFPLPGVDKTWLPGAGLLRDAPCNTAVFVAEGATDLLTACDLYSQYRRAGGKNSWHPVALLGAGCKALDPECADLIRDRHVRLIPDADDAGDKMKIHWTQLFREIGCAVDSISLPRGKDLTDCRAEIQTQDLFSK